MGIVFETLEDHALVEYIQLDRKLWLTADRSRVVEDGDLDAAFLYGVEGRRVPKPEAIRLGALPRAMVAEQEARTREKQARKPQDKMATSPSNKE